MFAITQAQTRHVELRTTPYQDWPEEAKQLARHVLSRPGNAGALIDQLDRKDWLVAKIEALQEQASSIDSWLGEE